MNNIDRLGPLTGYRKLSSTIHHTAGAPPERRYAANDRL